jgi:hypothetical protein
MFGRLGPPPGASQQVGARGVQQVVPVQLPARGDRLDHRQRCLRGVSHADRDGAVQIHDGTGCDPRELLVQPGDLGPVRLGRGRRGGVARGDGRLDLERPRPALVQCPFEDRGAFRDLTLIPLRAILLVQGDQITVGVDAGRPAGLVQQHQREQAVRLGLVGHQYRQHARETDRIGGQPGLPRVSVSLIEQEVEHVEDGGKALRQQIGGWHAKRDARVRDLLFGPEKALAHGAFRDQKRPRDLGRAEASQAPEGQRHLGVEIQ